MNFNCGSPAPTNRVGSYINVSSTPGGDERTLFTGSTGTGSQQQPPDPRFDLSYDTDADFFKNTGAPSILLLKLLQGKDDESVPLFCLELHTALSGTGEQRSKVGKKLELLNQGQKEAVELAENLQVHCEKVIRPWREKSANATAFLQGTGQDGAVGSANFVALCYYIYGGYKGSLAKNLLRDRFCREYFVKYGLSGEGKVHLSIQEITLHMLGVRLGLNRGAIAQMELALCNALLKLFQELGLYENPNYKARIETSIRNNELHADFSDDQIYMDSEYPLSQQRVLLKICVGLPFVPGSGHSEFKPTCKAGADGWKKTGRAKLIDDIATHVSTKVHNMHQHAVQSLAGLFPTLLEQLNNDVSSKSPECKEICDNIVLNKYHPAYQKQVNDIYSTVFRLTGQPPSVSNELPVRPAAPPVPAVMHEVNT